jgi:hypothetical protein
MRSTVGILAVHGGEDVNRAAFVGAMAWLSKWACKCSPRRLF